MSLADIMEAVAEIEGKVRVGKMSLLDVELPIANAMAEMERLTGDPYDDSWQGSTLYISARGEATARTLVVLRLDGRQWVVDRVERQPWVEQPPFFFYPRDRATTPAVRARWRALGYLAA